jgi:hypothetical protein
MNITAISTGKKLPKISVDNTWAKERMRRGGAQQTPTSLGILACLLYCIRLLIMRDVYKTCGIKKRLFQMSFLDVFTFYFDNLDLLTIFLQDFVGLRFFSIPPGPLATAGSTSLLPALSSTVAGGPLLSTDLRCVPSTKLWVLTSLAATEDESAGRTPKHLVCQDFIAPFSFSKIHPLLVDLAMASPTFIWLMRLAGFQRVRL